MPNLKNMYEIHIKKRIEEASKALKELNYDSIIIGSGCPYTYFSDDSDAIFRTNPHFAHWCPAKGPHHLIKFEPGKKPLLVYYSPEDFWHSHEELKNPFWGEYFEIVCAGEKEKLWSYLGNLSYSVFIGNETKYAQAAGVKINCDILTARLNWFRRTKSKYEIYCLSEANKLAAKGHNAAKKVFLNGGSEYEIHMNYLLAMNALDEELPYPGIVALNKNAAVLHYHKKEHVNNGKVLLIDSGALYNHYGADITRTYAAKKCNKVFKEILNQSIQMQSELCDKIKPGLYYPNLHEKCHIKIAEILKKVGIITMKEKFDISIHEEITRAFFPHGLGHQLGIQVHDIGGKQLDEHGCMTPHQEQSVKYRSLRFVGKLNEGMVVTVEPGIYFIPMLLNKLKQNKKFSKYVCWSLVDKMIPFGGIRIEDDILVTKNGNKNLTREFLND